MLAFVPVANLLLHAVALVTGFEGYRQLHRI
jgi:hypothetical protein